jgi:hypothetical protein
MTTDTIEQPIIETTYEAPKHILKHRDIPACRITVVDTNPQATFDISSFYISDDVKGIKQINALRDLLDAAVGKANELDAANGRGD